MIWFSTITFFLFSLPAAHSWYYQYTIAYPEAQCRGSPNTAEIKRTSSRCASGSSDRLQCSVGGLTGQKCDSDFDDGFVREAPAGYSVSLLRDTLQYFKAGTCVAYNSGFTRHMCSTDRVIISLCSDSQCNNCYQRTEYEFSPFTACVGTGHPQRTAKGMFSGQMASASASTSGRPLPPHVITIIAVTGSVMLGLGVVTFLKARKSKASGSRAPTSEIPPPEVRQTTASIAPLPPAPENVDEPAPPYVDIDTTQASAPPAYESLTPRTPLSRV